MIKVNAIFVGGKYNGKEVTHDELMKMGNGNFNKDMSVYRKQGACCQRAELYNQPLVEGYLSPMWDGDKLRYETYEVYDMLSR